MSATRAREEPALPADLAPPLEGTRERRVRLAGVWTRVLEIDGEGPSLLLLHGFSDSADTWRALLGRCSLSGRRAVAIDLPGFGGADDARPGAVFAQFEAVVAAAITLASGPSGQAPLLVGNSMGGAVALYVTNRRSAELAGVVPVCSAGLAHPLWVHAIASPGLRTVVPVLGTRPLRDAMGWPLARIVATRPTAELAAHMPRHLAYLTRSRIAHHVSIVRRLLSEERYPLDTASIACPVMFVWGGADRVVGSARQRRTLLRLSREVPNASCQVLPDCGHVPQLEMPDRLLALIDDFCPTVTTSARASP